MQDTLGRPRGRWVNGIVKNAKKIGIEIYAIKHGADRNGRDIQEGMTHSRL